MRPATKEDLEQEVDNFITEDVYKLEAEDGDDAYFKGSKKDLLVAVQPSQATENDNKVFFVTDGRLILMEKEK